MNLETRQKINGAMPRNCRAGLGFRSVQDLSTAELLAAAGGGDSQAWNQLVERYERLVWSVVRSFRLDEAASADVAQTVWLRLVEHCDRIRNPDGLASWLATTTRHEAIRTSKMQRRQTPTDFEFDVEDTTAVGFDELLVDSEDRATLVVAFRQLPEDSQQLLRLLTTDPPLDYETIAEIIGRPIGSIGPTRARCLDRLRTLMAAAERRDGPGD
ncbi:MAG TPA: sigma-70 family RNA polymerase sigma factor [Actinobacteria bacterium]|nr:sigma-70 family RNA polymerase sigma factor [Actinomycetota bacterium]